MSNVAAPSAAPATSSAPSTSASSAPSTSATSAPQTKSTPSASAPSAAPSDKGPISGAHDKPVNEPAASVAPEAAAPTEKPVAQERKKYNIAGKEVFMTPEEADKYVGLGYSANSKFQEAAQLRKEAEAFVQALVTDPESALSELGIDIDGLAEKRLTEKLKREMMDPVQRELEELRAWKQKQEEERTTSEKTRQEQAARQQHEQLRQQASQQYIAKMGEVLQKMNLPRTEETIQWLSEEVANAVRHGFDMDFELAASRVRNRYQSAIKSLVSQLDGEQLLEVLGGDDTVNKIRKFDLSRLQQQLIQNDPAAKIMAEKSIASAPTGEGSKPQSKQFLTPDDWKAQIAKKMGL